VQNVEFSALECFVSTFCIPRSRSLNAAVRPRPAAKASAPDPAR
jgi:hypothetical protein